MTKNKVLYEIVGWYGMVAILLGYLLTALGYWNVDNAFYKSFNLTGAIGLSINAYNKKALPPAVLNAIWAVIAIISIFS